MGNTRSSFPAVAEQILTFNQNLVQVLSSLNTVTSTTQPVVNVQITDANGILTQYSLPSISYLKNEIDRLNNNINSIYNINNSTGALIKPSANNVYQKVVAVNLNQEPIDLGPLSKVTNFVANPNWIFDSLVNPMLAIEIDLTDMIDTTTVQSVLSRRYIISFQSDSAGNLTPTGQSALNSFNTTFNNISNININDFLNWYSSTPGVVNPTAPTYDERIFPLEPNQLLFDGIFSVLSTSEDIQNGKLWYYLDTLNYTVTGTTEVQILKVGDQVTLNTDSTSTIYQIIEISTVNSNYGVRFQRVQGNQPIPIGTGTIKIYSPVVYTQKVQITVGYNEYCVVFIKPINSNSNIMSKNWSNGTGFFTNNLTLSSNDNSNGLSMQQYYTNYVYDYGVLLEDLIAKKIPNSLGTTPASPTLVQTNFQVVQTNTHLTDTPDSNTLKEKASQVNSLKSQISQINSAVASKNAKARTYRFTSPADAQKLQLEIASLQQQQTSVSNLLTTTNQEIIDMANSPGLTSVTPEFSVRGFWALPNPTVTSSTNPQQIVQFITQYRRLSSDGRESQIQTFNISDSQGNTQPAAYSNWIQIESPLRSRTYDPSTNSYSWDPINISSTDSPNINQIDIPIQPNEQIEIRVKSVSEVGWPDSPLESDWSPSVIIQFPDSLNNTVNQNQSILQQASNDSLQNTINSNLSAKGLDAHLADATTVNNNTYFHTSEHLLSGFTDANGVALDLYDYLVSLQNRVAALEEQISNAQGVLQVVILRNNQQFIVDNGSQLTFNIECEDYLDQFVGSANTPTVQPGRVYANNIYVIKDFVMQINNIAASSPLGLLSSRTYGGNSDNYNSNAPQIFWVDDKDNLLTSASTGTTQTQLDNQFIWNVNFDSVTGQNVIKLADDIGNSFIANNNNSITSVLGENEFNIGYNQNSILQFVGNNNSLLDVTKWIDTTISVASTSKLLTTIHPVTPTLDDITDTNTAKVHSLNAGSSVNIPINIYFKMNALDPNQSGLNYEYIDLNGSKSTIKHVKEVKFLLENQADNTPFTFSILFNINRSKLIVQKSNSPINPNSAFSVYKPSGN